ncbi:MAG TPA: hypothetical protein VEY11_14475 [Pyrinomonadaceae bacterium]|nr:hypothetical protein [Pyrinomonadaceae bacterium]
MPANQGERETAINPASAIPACDGADIPVIIPVNVLSKNPAARTNRLTPAIILRRLLPGDRFILSPPFPRSQGQQIAAYCSN